VKNAAGERLVGFLHVPRDAATDVAAPVTDQATRHAATREVIGAALRGYVDEAHRAGTEPTRVLLTGYGTWGGVLNNPTGDFVSHRENIDAAMRQAFGRHLVTGHGRRVGGDANADTWSYRVRDPATGRQREVQVQARRLPVADEAINGSKQSLQTSIATFRPHGVISMGVHGGSDFLAEHRADDGGLRVDANGKQVHDDEHLQTRQHADNYALPRAIERGARPAAVSVNDLGLHTIDRSLQAFAGRRATRVT
jgi:pyrrolidone-carboxylate peptidase